MWSRKWHNLPLQTLADLEGSGKNTLNSSASLCSFSNEGVIYVGYIVNNSSLFYVWQICKFTLIDSKSI
jgi:hypothetical protein